MRKLQWQQTEDGGLRTKCGRYVIKESFNANPFIYELTYRGNRLNIGDHLPSLKGLATKDNSGRWWDWSPEQVKQAEQV